MEERDLVAVAECVSDQWRWRDGAVFAQGSVSCALGVGIWWLNHADPHMRVLMDKEGPFKQCAYDGHKPARTPGLASLAHSPPEAGFFD